MIYTSCFLSTLGKIKITASATGLISVLFVDEDEGMQASKPANSITENTVAQLEEYFSGTRTIFDIPLSPVGTAFQQQVWQELVKIPFGKIDTYSSISRKLNNPLSVREVGAANGKNPIAILIPCHRVIGADGGLTGYAGGLWRKEKLLKLEGFLKNCQATLWS